MANEQNGDQTLRERIHEIIFEADTFYGALFDILLLIAIVASIVVVCLDTVPGIGRPRTARAVADFSNVQPALELNAPESGEIGAGNNQDPGSDPFSRTAPGKFSKLLFYMSWFFTILFTIEYVLRIYCVKRPWKYITSFWGIIDVLSFLPDYLLVFTPFDSRAFSVIRSLRLLRVFRIFRLAWFQFEAEDLASAVWKARAKIVVFLTVVMIIVTVVGTLMYEIEHWLAPDHSQFGSIPEGVYWAIVTMTTVGFGDIVPVTAVGKFLSALLILIGYSLIIVPTGFVTAEVLSARKRKAVTTVSCASCVTEGHDEDAKFCKYCGDSFSRWNANASNTPLD